MTEILFVAASTSRQRCMLPKGRSQRGLHYDISIHIPTVLMHHAAEPCMNSL
jgi:hypothetical protein